MASNAFAHEDRLTSLFVTGLKNAHAMEKQALSIMTPQVQRLQHYPEVAERLRSHIEETEGQIGRLDEILDEFDAQPSSIKDLGLSIVGAAAALGHAAAGDEILKNSFANYAFEHFEIASYKSLLTMAENGGLQRFSSKLQESLDEELSMAEWIDRSLPMVTRRYQQLYAERGSSEAKA
jgi:ferritin-like metal-binding protein YciE